MSAQSHPSNPILTDTDPQQELPVTVTVSRKVKPGQEAAYEAWLHSITLASQQFPGHQGANVLRPSDATKGEYVTLYRFDSYVHAQAWEESEERAVWIAKLPPLVAGEVTRKRVTGLEFWFDLPSVPIAAKPVQYKMALTLMVVVYSLLILLSNLFAPLTQGWPSWAKPLLTVPVQVTLMTYLVMPRVTQLLRHWLYR